MFLPCWKAMTADGAELEGVGTLPDITVNASQLTCARPMRRECAAEARFSRVKRQQWGALPAQQSVRDFKAADPVVEAALLYLRTKVASDGRSPRNG